MDINEILQYLPHRYPFLLLDRVLEIEPKKSLTAIKNVSYNEPFFQGHFPRQPVMPAVLTLEAMAQATGILAMVSLGLSPSDSVLYYFVGADKARFRRPVVPGDQLRIEVEVMRLTRSMCKVKAKATVEGDLAASAELMGALKDLDS